LSNTQHNLHQLRYLATHKWQMSTTGK